MKNSILIGVAVAVIIILVLALVELVVQGTLSRPKVVGSLTGVAGDGVSHAAWSPDGHKIIYQSSGLWTVNADGTDRASLGEGILPAWSPDGSRIAFVSDNALTVMHPDGTGRATLATLGEVLPDPLQAYGSIPYLAWSPDGASIAFVVEVRIEGGTENGGDGGTEQADIWTVAPDSSSLRQVTADPAREWDPVWSPDSRMLAFTSDRDEGAGWDIWVADMESGGEARLTSGEETEWAPEWSPDGSRLAYSADGEIWTMDADGANGTRVAEGPEDYESPAWSPDGSMIAFDSTANGPDGHIWAAYADGTGRTRLTRSSRSFPDCTTRHIGYKEPRWSPDGARLLFLNLLTEADVGGGQTSGYDRLWVRELDLDKGLG